MPLHERQGYGETSSRTLPFVSIANAPVMTAATSAALANIQNTEDSPPPIMKPTAVGPIIEAKRSHAVAVPTPSARVRVGKAPACRDRRRC